MTRERLLILYAVVVGGAGWFILLLTPQPPTSAFALLLFGLLALLLDGLSFRVPPTDPYSMRGVALLGAALTLGPAPAAMLAATTGLIFGLALPFVYRRPRTLYALIARPLLRSGVLAMGVLSGGVLASAISGLELNDPLFTTIGSQPWWLLLVCMVACYSLVLQFGRIGRELLQGGKSGVQTWWRSAWRVILLGEVATLPLAALLAAIFSQLGPFYFLLAGLALLGTSAVVRRSTMNYQSQRRSVRELALLNEVSRAIIRSPLDAEALCDLVYREATKIVDTSSFHLGLFEGDRYTLVVRVQDRVRLPPLIVTLEAGDGLIGWIKQTGRSLLVEDFASEMSSLPARPRYQSDRPPRS
ncbi:MAG: serine/threonine protein phosphatase, partial [Chloroflexaceae bacterium]|nr:serine/threonine protein phosphatase [Chloroflexaceae bacterium]